MDLNELLHAHQVEVMKASASGDETHFRLIAEYAERIRRLRTISPANSPLSDASAPPTIIYGSYAGESAPQEPSVRLARTPNGFSREQNEIPTGEQLTSERRQRLPSTAVTSLQQLVHFSENIPHGEESEEIESRNPQAESGKTQDQRVTADAEARFGKRAGKHEEQRLNFST